MPKLIAVLEHRYGGKLQKPGDVYEANTKHANLLTRVRKAKYASDEAPPPVATKPAEIEPTKPSRLKRRDMRAER